MQFPHMSATVCFIQIHRMCKFYEKNSSEEEAVMTLLYIEHDTLLLAKCCNGEAVP